MENLMKAIELINDSIKDISNENIKEELQAIVITLKNINEELNR